MRARSEAGARQTDVIEVDFAALARLTGAIRTLADELSGNGSLYGQMNDPDLAEVFYRAERDWHKQRVTLQTFLDRTAQSVTAGLTAYHQLESEVAAAAGMGR